MKGCVIMATIGFEEELWASADKLRNNMDAAEYKHVVSRSIRINIFKIRFRYIYGKIQRVIRRR